VILLRTAERALEVLLVKRNPQSRFMGGAWVFPGGAVDAAEGEGETALRAAALRELEEEAGITLGSPTELVSFSRWITPAEIKIRFDTWFFLALAPAQATPRIDGSEVVDWCWCQPRSAVESARRGELFLVFPTVKTLEQLSSFVSAQQLLAHARGRAVAPIQPRVVGAGDDARIVLPGDPCAEP
jgi:8-oxo-dGTP pyrophosphatase MutT (NUDIX family)